MSELEALRKQAEELGLKPHHMAKEAKLREMIEDAGAAPVAVAPVREDAIPADHVRLRVRHKGAGKINTGNRIEDPIRPYDETYPEGEVITLPAYLADIYLKKDWVDPA